VADRAKRFQAVLEKGSRALGWTIARVPFTLAELQAAAGKPMVRLRVRGSVNGFAPPKIYCQLCAREFINPLAAV
jgi:hypothetical protein